MTAKIIRVNNPERLCRFPLAPVATLRVTDDISVSYDRDKLPPINTHCCCFILILQGRNIARHRVTTTQKGWQATLDLRFHQAGGKTVLASAQHVGPLTVQRPFYPEEETCHLYLLHPPGGIVGGDELTISAHLAPGCHTLITMPGASKFYRSSGAQALVRQQLTLAPQATLEWLPQDAIFFPGANARLFTTFHLCASSRLLAWDLLCLGRPVIGETFSHGTLSNRLEVWVDDEPLLVERLQLQEESSPASPNVPGSALCCAIRLPMPCSTGCATRWRRSASTPAPA